MKRRLSDIDLCVSGRCIGGLCPCLCHTSLRIPHRSLSAPRKNKGRVPRRAVDRELARSLKEVRKGRVAGPFRSADAMLTDLRKRISRSRYEKKQAKTTP